MIGLEKPVSPAAPELAHDSDPFAEFRMADMHNAAARGGDTRHAARPQPVPDKFGMPAFPGMTREGRFDFDGQHRRFWVHIPEHYDPKTPPPVVMIFNGYGSSKNQGDAPAGGAGMEQVTQMSRKSDENGFIVVYMDGNPDDKHSWNNGQWFFSNRNDFQLVDTVLNHVNEQFGTDKDRIYLAGFSQGGSFVHRLASEMPGRFAAIATVSSWMSGKEPVSAVSSLHLHSKDDSAVPMDGRFWGLTMQPQEYLRNYYELANGLSGKMQQYTQDGGARGNIKFEHETNPVTGREFEYVTVEKEGHHWFGGPGNDSSPIKATDIVWDFFKRHTRDH